MKYLNSRDNYLKKINERREIELHKKFDLLTPKLILEENEPGSGAFGNNVRWGDSLLGRFINFVVRKIGVGIDMGRISLVSKQLRSQFDRLITESAINLLTDDQKQDISRVQISTIIGVLKKAVEDGEKVSKLKDITQECIDNVNSLDVNDELKEKKQDLIDALKEFLKFLEKFKDAEGEGGPLSEDAEKTTDDEESESDSDESEEVSGDKTLKSSYPTMIKNLKALSLVLSTYKRFKPNVIKKSEEEGANDFYVTKGGETIESIQKDTNVNKNKLSLEQIWSKNISLLKPYDEKAVKSKMNKYSLQLAKGLKLSISTLQESFIFEEGPIQTSNVGSKTGIGTGGSVNRNMAVKVTDKEGNVKVAEDHLTQAYAKIKKSCENLESAKDKGIGVTIDFLKNITDKANSEEGKKAIKELYREILRYLIGDKKGTLNASQDTLFKESLDVISDKNKRTVVAEKIARFTVRAMQFDGQNLYGSLGEFGKPLKEFVDSIKELNKIDKDSLIVKKTEERLSILKYDGYLQLIREADESTESTEEDPEEDKDKEVSDEIREYFKELEVAMREDFLITEEEAKKLESEVEKSKNTKSIVIGGMNPIIEIVKLFNRAYKLHTTDVIPGNRSDGKIDRLTYNEYTAFGGGSGQPSATDQGPYRHKKTFNIWETAVMDCLGDTKYSPVFAKETKIDDGAGNIKEGAGVALRRFMLDLLDGDELYKSGGSGSSSGAQKRALNEYFGEVSESFFEKNSDVKFGIKDKKTGKTDDEDVASVADEITTTNLQFTKSSDLLSDEVLKEGKFKWTFFQIRGKKDGNLKTYYVHVREGKDNKYYLMISETFYHFRNILSCEFPSSKIDKGSSSVPIELRDRIGSGLYPIVHTVILKNELQKLGQNALKEIIINGLKKEGDKVVIEKIDFIPTEVNWLVKRNMEGKKFTGQNILKISSEKEDPMNKLIIGIKPAFPKIREVVDKKYDDGKFTPGITRK